MTLMSSTAVAVNEKEYELLTLARAVMGQSNQQISVLLRTARPDPTGLSTCGLRVFQRTLSMGTVRCLAAAGGARRETFNKPKAERLWARFGPDKPDSTPKLAYTNLTWTLLQWALVTPLSYSQAHRTRYRNTSDPETEKASALPEQATASGDVAVVFLLARLLIENSLSDCLREPLFMNNALVQLAYADKIALCLPTEGTPRATKLPDFVGFINRHSLLVEGFSQWITAGILAADTAPNTFEAAITVSQHRRRVYAAWMKACTETNRKDLAVCLVDAGVRAMNKPAPVPIADPTAAMRDRAAAARAGVVLAETTVFLSDWSNNLGQLDFFDEGYQAAVNLRSRWSKLDNARMIAEGRIRDVAGV